MLFNGEEVGDGDGPECDVAVDPIDGTTLTAKGMANAISVLAVSPRGSMYDPSAVFYMEKLVTGPEAADVVDIRYPVAENIHQVAKAKGSKPEDVTVVLLDRPRHEQLAEEIRATGARIKFITDGDVAGAIMAAREGTGIDLLLGIGGTPEGIIAACAMKCLDGVIQGRLWPTDDEERQRAIDAGHDLDRVLLHRRPRLRRRLLLRRHRHHRRRADAGRALQGRRGHDPLAGDALAQRHDPLDPHRAQAARSCGPTPTSTSSAERPCRTMVVVVGEALIDVVVDPDGDTEEAPGGSPLNVAVGLARLDVPATLITQVGHDERGEHGRRTTSPPATPRSSPYRPTTGAPRPRSPASTPRAAPATSSTWSGACRARSCRRAARCTSARWGRCWSRAATSVLDLVEQAVARELFISYDANLREPFVDDREQHLARGRVARRPVHAGQAQRRGRRPARTRRGPRRGRPRPARPASAPSWCCSPAAPTGATAFTERPGGERPAASDRGGRHRRRRRRVHGRHARAARRPRRVPVDGLPTDAARARAARRAGPSRRLRSRVSDAERTRLGDRSCRPGGPPELLRRAARPGRGPSRPGRRPCRSGWCAPRRSWPRGRGRRASRRCRRAGCRSR